MARAVLGFVIGGVLWMASFYALTFLVAFAWPAYAEHGRTWFETGVFTFEPPMAVVNVIAWALAEVEAGFMAVVIGRRREAGWALAAAIALFLCFVHLYWNWSAFPWWYNLTVALPAAPAVLLGAGLAGGFARQRPAASARA